MRVPSRVYVGVVVFGLIASLSTLSYVVLVVSGYQPPPESPHEALFPPEEESVPGQTLFLVLAAAFSIGFTVLAVQALIRGARQDEAFKRMKPALRQELKRRKREEARDAEHQDDGPPGYS